MYLACVVFENKHKIHHEMLLTDCKFPSFPFVGASSLLCLWENMSKTSGFSSYPLPFLVASSALCLSPLKWQNCFRLNPSYIHVHILFHAWILKGKNCFHNFVSYNYSQKSCKAFRVYSCEVSWFCVPFLFKERSFTKRLLMKCTLEEC